MKNPHEDIKLLRSRGWTQQMIADKIGCSQPMVAKWESGDVSTSAIYAYKLSEAVRSNRRRVKIG
jgi:transcriptional regulator with XRE-family HTH domain